MCLPKDPIKAEEYKQAIRDRWADPEYREKQHKARIGKVISQEQKDKQSAALKGRKITWADKISATVIQLHKDGVYNNPITKERLSATLKANAQKPDYVNPMTGNDPWNKGLTKETDPTVAKYAESLKNFYATDEGKEVKKEAYEKIDKKSFCKKISLALTGHKLSETTKRKIGDKAIGRPRTVESIEKGINTVNERYPDGNFKMFNTKPELAAEQILINNNLNYKKQKPIKDKVNKKVRVYDFFLVDYNILLEIDGTYWHGKNISDEDIKTDLLKGVRENDKYKDKLANGLGYNLLRVWSDELDKLDEYCRIMLWYRKKEQVA